MNILDFTKFNLDNTLTQNKSLFDNCSNTSKGYTDSPKTDFNNMIDKINLKSKTLEPENKMKVSNNKIAVSDKNTSVKITNNTNSISDNTAKISKQDFTPDSVNTTNTAAAATVTSVSSDFSAIKSTDIKSDIKASEDNTSLVNEDLVAELETLLSEFSTSDDEMLSDLKTLLKTDVDTDMFSEEMPVTDEVISDTSEEVEISQDTDTEEVTDEVTKDVGISENIAADVQDIIVKENLDNYSEMVSDKEMSGAAELVKNIAETSNSDINKDLKNEDSQNREKQIAFVKDNDNKFDLKTEKVFVKTDDLKTQKESSNNDYNYESQDVINLEETVEASDTVKDMNIKVNQNKNTKDYNFDNTKISKKDLEDLKVKIEEVFCEEKLNNNEFQSNPQTAQENLIKLSIDGMDNLTKMHKTETVNLNFAKVLNQTNTEELTQKNIVSQIYSKIQDMHQGSKMVMTLNPESLGKVQIEIVNSKTGLIAQMSVTNNAVKDILSKDLDGLRSALNAQGINVDSINVKIDENLNNSGKDDYLEQDKNKENNQEFSKNKKEDEEEKKDKQKFFENLMDNIVKDNIKE